jgi:DNA adenine methylase
LNINASSYILADTNQDLITVYKALIDKREQFIEHCRTLFCPENNILKRYYELRSEFNDSTDGYRRACIFIYLNRHCWNGLIRFNASGKFNTPFGKYKEPYFPEEEMTKFAKVLGNAKFEVADFTTTMAQAQTGDFVYCDPPYVPMGETGFTAYAKGGFSIEDQESLIQCCKKAVQNGATVAISNHDNAITRELYKDANEIVELSVKRTINCKGDDRAKVREIIAIYGQVVGKTEPFSIFNV